MRFCLPQIFFLGLFAILGQIANAKNKFGPMMWAPVLNNLTSIIFLIWLLQINGQLFLSSINYRDLVILGLGTTISYSLQAFILFPVVIKSGIKLRLIFDWKNKFIIRSLRLASWSFIYATISQISYLVTVIISTGAAVNAFENGIDFGVGYTPYANAYLILLVPHSIITVSVVTAMLPQLSNYILDKKLTDFSNLVNKCIKIVGVFTIPSSIIFLGFGPLIAKSLFIGITDSDAHYLGLVLSAFSLSLIPVSINLIMLRVFNAFEDMKTQVVINFAMNLISILASVILSFYLEAQWVTVGLAAVFTFHYFVGITLSTLFIRNHHVDLKFAELSIFYIRIALISILTIMPLWVLRDYLPGGNIIRLITVLVSTLILFLLAARIFKIGEVSTLLNVLKNKKGIEYESGNP